MNKIERRLMEEGLLEEKDIKRKTFDFSWIYIHFANSLAKSMILLFILLAIGLASAISGSVDLTMVLVVLSAIGAVITFKNAFLANIYAVSALFIIPMYYTENIYICIYLIFFLFINIILLQEFRSFFYFFTNNLFWYCSDLS